MCQKGSPTTLKKIGKHTKLNCRPMHFDAGPCRSVPIAPMGATRAQENKCSMVSCSKNEKATLSIQEALHRKLGPSSTETKCANCQCERRGKRASAKSYGIFLTLCRHRTCGGSYTMLASPQPLKHVSKPPKLIADNCTSMSPRAGEVASRGAPVAPRGATDAPRGARIPNLSQHRMQSKQNSYRRHPAKHGIRQRALGMKPRPQALKWYLLTGDGDKKGEGTKRGLAGQQRVESERKQHG
jgi:hypothetical protein